MSHSLYQRTAAVCLSVLVTLAMLGSIDHLAQRDEAVPQWAQQAVPSAQPRV